MTGISWTDETWNPTTGCDRVSPGCDHCYALTMAKRLKGMGQTKYQRDGDPRTSGPGFGLSLHPDALDLPLHWRKPRRVFVNSMSDLFHEKVPDGFIACAFAIMAATPQHTYQILTKRHGRMRSLLNNRLWWQYEFASACRVRGVDYAAAAVWDRGAAYLPNVHLGVSAENQKWAEIRIPALLGTLAAVRWVSAEPLLGPISFWPHDHTGHDSDYIGEFPYEWSTCLDCSGFEDEEPRVPWTIQEHRIDVDWIVAGGESGPGARPCELAWLRTLRDQCAETGTPFFCKQLGAVLGRQYGGDPHGADWDHWPEDLRVREFPVAAEQVPA